MEQERLGLGERLALARRRLGLRQWEVAREIGVSQPTVSRVESGYYAASDETREKMRSWLEAHSLSSAAR